MKINGLQGKDTSEDIPDEILLVEQQPEEIPEVQSDTHIAEPDTVSLKEDNEHDVPPPPTTDAPVGNVIPPAEDKVVSPSENEGEVVPPSGTEGEVSAETKEDILPSSEGEVAPPSEENVPPTTEGVPPASTTEADAEKSAETTEKSNGVDSKGL